MIKQHKGNILFMLVGYILFMGCSAPQSPLQILKDKNKHALDSIRNDVLNSYKDTIKIDTFVIIDKRDTASVKFRHYCSYDKKINIPREYLDVYKLSKFQTHNFVSQIEFKINSRIVYKCLITKGDFEDLLSDSLKKYGVLKYSPDISISRKTVSIEYSIGIPLAGVESGYVIQIDSSGKKHAGQMD